MKKRITLMGNGKATRNLALGLMMSMGAFLSLGQTVTTSLATGTSTTGEMPIYGNYGYNYSQQIYLASDFEPAIQGTPSVITKIRFFYVSGNMSSSTAWNVYMGLTANTSFATTTSWIPLANLTPVFSGNLTSPGGNSWMEITLSTPFTWDGVSNVVVAIDENTPGYSDMTWRSHATGANRSILYRNDSNNPDPASPPTATARFGYVAQTQFVHTPTVACAGAPDHASAVTSLSSVCSNAPTPVNFSATGGSFLTGLAYQWQSNNGAGWVDYSGATSTTYAANLTETVNVRLITTCVATGDQDISEEASVAVNPAPTVTTDAASLAYCSGNPAAIVAAGAETYVWSPATGLDNTTSDMVVANPANPTTYTVIGTDLQGCKDTATVMVTPLSKIQRTASYAPVTLCTPGTAVTITAAASPVTVFGGGTYEYRFIDANGAVLQDWGAGNTYQFTPGADSVYKVYTDFRSSACADGIDSIATSIVVGFGADVAVTNYDCINLGGTVALNQVFGQPEVETVYSNPFASVSDVTSVVTLNGSAAIADGRAVLTPSATGVNGSVVINDPAFHTGLNNAMTISFHLTTDLPIGPYGTGGADGISYSFGDDVSNTGNQNGSGSKLRLSFDANDNSPNMSGIYLTYGFNSVTLTPANALIHVGNIALWKMKQDVPVVLTINPSGKASLTVDGTTVFENVQMPAAYMNANTTGWKHVFGAATGGDGMRQAISNVSMTVPSLNFALTPAGEAPATWVGTSTFTNVQPGTYDVWLSSNGSASCAKKIETVEVVNTNPLVVLGNDTTICEGQSLTLDAGNAGASYVWSNSQITTQTRVVNQAGNYVVNVTMPNGCVGVGTINVSVMGAPTASTIYVENDMPSYTFTVLNPQNTNQYSWDFGDGTLLANAPGTVSHTYLTAGPRQVSVTLTNECGTETVITTVVVTSTADVATNTIEGLNVYPNPAHDDVVIELPDGMQATGSVYNTAGSLIRTMDVFSVKTTVNMGDMPSGVYFLHIQSEEKMSVIKLMVE